MPRVYADMSALISQKLQDTGVAEFLVASINYQIEECLKEIFVRFPHIVPIVFKIESRHGQDTAGTASTLTDTTKSQFLSTDPANEKVVYNSTEHTWATIISYTSTSVVGLSADIMNSGDTYFIFNKRCRNNRQINISSSSYNASTGLREGYAFDIYNALRAEYPCNSWPRNWRNIYIINDEVIELDLDIEPDDSDSTLSNLGRTEVLVEFKRPHILSQLTDWAGELTADAAVGATSIAVDGMGTVEVIEEGEEFYLENKRTLYTVTKDVTMVTGAGTLYIYPPLEAAATDNDNIHFVRSTIPPNLEDIFADLCTARLLINQAPKYFKTIGAGGADMWKSLLTLGEHKLGETLARLSMTTPRTTKRSYPST